MEPDDTTSDAAPGPDRNPRRDETVEAIEAAGSATAGIATSGGEPSPGLALRVGLVAVVTLVAFESLAVITILPDVETDLGGLAWYGWVTTAFFLGTMLGIVFAGDQTDRRGAGPPYLGGLVLFAVGLLVGGLAPSMPVLVLGRFVQGFGAGVVPAIGYIAIGRLFAPAERPRMFAILSTAWIVPGIFGPVLAERVAHTLSWRWVFLGLLPLVAVAGMVVLPPIFKLGPAQPAAEPAGRDDGEATTATSAHVPSTSASAPAASGTEPSARVATLSARRRMYLAARVAAGAALVIAGLDNRPLLMVGGIVAGLAVGLPALIQIVPPGTLRATPGLPAVVLSRGLLTFAFLGTDTFVPYALVSGRGRTTLAGSVAVTMTTLAWTSASWLQQRRIAELGERIYIRRGFLVLAPAIAIVAFGALPDVAPFWVIHIGWTFGGFAIGLAYSAHAQQLLRLAPAGGYGNATSSMQLFDNLGVALGTGILGAAVSSGVDGAGWRPGSAVAVALLITLAVAVGGIALSRRLDPGRVEA